MKNKNLLQVALRNKAIYIPETQNTGDKNMNKNTAELVNNLKKLGFGLEENLLLALSTTTDIYKREIYDTLQYTLGTKHNWTPLVKNWEIPTEETRNDHFMTKIWNVFQVKEGSKLACGHIIPPNTFPLERYNGCPFCGTPFQFGEIESFGKGSKIKVLQLWTTKDAENYLHSLLSSKTALDATQIDSLKLLLEVFEVPNVEMQMKETIMVVIEILVSQNKFSEAGKLMKTPTDILRYLWYMHTGYLQIVEPKVIIKRLAKNHQHHYAPLDTSAVVKIASKKDLELKYSRTECKMVAEWLNNLPQKTEAICENMHPKRGMWIRFIRALRLSEYSKKKGFEKLQQIVDVFYRQDYTVLEGRLQYFKLKSDEANTFALLKQRPGLFARSLFANMLWFGEDLTLQHFEEVVDQIPMRLLVTLNSYAELYFSKNNIRNVKTLGGTNKTLPPNQWVAAYEEDQLNEMKQKVEVLTLKAFRLRFSKIKTENKTIYIDPTLFQIPLAIGNRSENTQDLPAALMGTRFPMEGDTIRLFMQWGKDMPAQHLDMDLSCHIAYEDSYEVCSYYQLKAVGCKHSGDIRSIPNKIGTAEYININLTELRRAKAQYVTFTCNAYSNGSISPNLVVGWMDSKNPMKISESTGVAYDPSCVIHQVRITNSVSKGMVFGVLDVAKGEIIWLEMTFGGQNIQTLDNKGVFAMIKQLDAKMKIGDILKIKAEAQNLTLVSSPEVADEIYTSQWAIDSAKVTQLLID